jgi:hypothetical protein
MAYVGTGGQKKQRQMCRLTTAGEILPLRIPMPWGTCAVVCIKRPTAHISE